MTSKQRLKDHGDILVWMAEVQQRVPPDHRKNKFLEVCIHHEAGMTITLDSDEALALLDFLRQREHLLGAATSPEAL